MAENEKKVDQLCLFDREPKLWEKEWVGMPEFTQGNLEPYRTIRVHFKNEEDIALFAALIEQKISDKTKYVWFPRIELIIVHDKRWISRLEGEGEPSDACLMAEEEENGSGEEEP
jgi:hypothetical protein